MTEREQEEMTAKAFWATPMMFALYCALCTV